MMFTLFVFMLFLSWNVNGLRDLQKMDSVFSIVKNTYANVIFLQETFWDDNFIETYKHKWDGSLYYNNCRNGNRKGVAILFTKNFPYKTNFHSKDDNGRILKVDFHDNDICYSCVNVYAPNVQTERLIFFNSLNSFISGENNIVAGDFNEIIETELDKGINVKTFNVASNKCLCNIININNLCDVWRHKHPGKREFTRQQFVNGVLKQSRIDMLLISRHMLSFVSHAFIKYSSISDHNLLCMSIDFTNVERGQGMWVFNNTLLDNSVFTENIRSLINDSLKCPLYTSEILIWWDNLKYKMKKCAIYHSCIQRKKEKSEYYAIQNSLQREYEKLSKFPNRDTSHILNLEKELELYEKKKCDGAILRSKVSWALETDKNTSFFLKLEKSNQESNCIKELNTEKGLTSKTEDILDHVFQFYSKLYSAEEVNIDKQNEILNLITEILSENDKNNLDKVITEEELTSALKGMKLNKSPGNDGLTVEFYIHFWDILRPLFIKVVNACYEDKELTRTMKRGVISLFYKKKGDKRDIKNFRPISLLNVDSKLISRTLAGRLKYVLSSIISPEQSCCIPGRDISDNILSIKDVIDISTDLDDAYLISIDQEKAFDRVSHSFLFKILEKLNFGNVFISWIKLLYNGLRSCVKVNGHLTPYFDIERSVRQGDPLSSMLYVIVSQPLNLLIKNNPDIHGIDINNVHTSLIYQHADDTSVSVSDTQSVYNTFETVNTFCQATGAKVNLNKSEVLCIGKCRLNNISFNLPVSVKYDCIKVLGIYLGPNKNVCEINNWKSKISKIKSLMGLWSQRNLTLQGKSIVLNTFMLSRLWYCIHVLPVPEWVLNEINAAISKFVWSDKPPLINKTTVINHFLQGGLSLPSIKHKIFAFRLKLVKKLFDNEFQALWKYTFWHFISEYCHMSLKENIFCIVYNNRDLKYVNQFHAEVLSAWDEITCGSRDFPTEHVDIMEQPLFHNPHVRHQGKLLYFQFFVDSGIVTLSDLCYVYTPGFLPLSAVIEIVHEKRLDISSQLIKDAYFVILQSLPQEWVNIISRTSASQVNKKLKTLSFPTDDGVISSNNLTVKFSYRIFVQYLSTVPKALDFWNSYCLSINWNLVWYNVFDNDKSAEQRDLDFRICHNVIFTKEKLFKFGMSDSSLCPVCQKDPEDILHMFVFCDELFECISIMKSLLTDIFKDTGYSFNDLVSYLLFGYQSKRKTPFHSYLNIVLSIYRVAVFKRRSICSLQGKSLNICNLFKAYVRQHFKLLSFHYHAKNCFESFRSKYISPVSFIEELDNSLNFKCPFND